jgi:hypothetical protein
MEVLGSDECKIFVSMGLWWKQTHGEAQAWIYGSSVGYHIILPFWCPNVYLSRIFWGILDPFHVAETELMDKIHHGDGVEVYQADITRLEERTIHLSDGTKLETDILIHTALPAMRYSNNLLSWRCLQAWSSSTFPSTSSPRG